MADFLKMGMNRQNLAIEKSLQLDTTVTDVAYQVVTVERNDGYPAVGSVPAGSSERDGTANVSGSYAVATNLDDVSGFATDIAQFYVDGGQLVVLGKNNTWTQYTFLVF